jgi:hypothetical protein
MQQNKVWYTYEKSKSSALKMCPPYQAHVINDNIPKEAPTYSVLEEEVKDVKRNE